MGDGAEGVQPRGGGVGAKMVERLSPPSIGEQQANSFAVLVGRHPELEIPPIRADFVPVPGTRQVHALVLGEDLNGVPDLDTLMRRINEGLVEGGQFLGVVETNSQRKTRLGGRRSGIRGGLARIRWVADFVFHRVVPRLSFSGWVYKGLCRRPHRALSLTETLGRLVYFGFDIADVENGPERTAFVVRKARPSPTNPRPESVGILYSMHRLGKGGEPIKVYKFRTMHAYAQYLQAYVFEGQALASDGKFNNDFRVTRWGRFMRRYWLDELPMLINWLKGELKLVGVRPISRHYLGLYPDDVKELRAKVKPGLIPPFYADLPTGLDEIVESERRYLEASLQRPLRTDLLYLRAAIWNILIRSQRSA